MIPTCTPERLEAAYRTALAALMKERNPDGYWVGELSTSALSTATAVMALYLVQKHTRQNYDALIEGGLNWLVKNQNADGGWGDTTRSFSNISTTMLCRAAIHLTGAAPRLALAVSRAETWLFAKYGNTPGQLAEAVRQRYGKDRTFATPILTTCALAGLVDWKEVPPLPFELAVFPQSWFRFLRLHVVSYALPALIAIGQCIFHFKKPWNPFILILRWLSRQRSLRVLEKIQPTSGGFLEAIPLTSFVTLSLASIGLADHVVAKKGVEFLVNAVRPDGSWAIDSNLSTWVTTLAINALAAAGELASLDRKEELRIWLLKQQYQERHPYTGAAPGGWAWTPLSGGVPDADDTPGALIAIGQLTPRNAAKGKLPLDLPIQEGLIWLMNLQNRNGGWPTFCRGWGHLPFDRSGSDLTGHALRAFSLHGRDFFGEDCFLLAVQGKLTNMGSHWGRDALFFRGLQRAFTNALAYLARQQRSDGSWLPLWFGNQHAPDDENPTYGTARVLAAYRDLGLMDNEPARRGVAWLLSAQNEDGGWGGTKNTPSSLEETALAVEILLDAGLPGNASDAIQRGLAHLVDRVETGGLFEPTPIGFYFAKLWYYEKLYPIIFTVAALGKARQRSIR